MKIKTIILTVILIALGSVKAQCVLNTTPGDVTITCGQSVDMSTFATGNVPLLVTDFDNGTAGPGWTVGGGNGFGSPCGANPSGTPYYWASTAGSATPELATVGFDVSCGGYVSFDMAYSTQGGSSPCEGPDLANEGVTFQYSIDGGLTWVLIQYWDPNGGNDPMLTSWNTYTIPIPPGAMGPSTMFGWIQQNSSGACCDNWGLDNVIINPGLCGNGYTYDWSQVPGSSDSTFQTVTPVVSTQYTLICTNGVDICYDTINITVTPWVADATTTVGNLFCGDCADLDITLINNNAGSIVDDFDPTEDPLLWSNIQNGVAGTGCGGVTGNGLYFDGTGADRTATTIPINTTICGTIDFCLYMGNSNSGGAPCENADNGENVVLEYSNDLGVTWVNIATYDQSLWDLNNAWQCFNIIIPAIAQTPSTMFRWDQISFSSCSGCDNWSLDNVSIACLPPAFDYSWTPTTGLNDPLIQQPQACPLVTTTYVGTITEPATGCWASDSVTIDVLCGCFFDTLTGVVSDCENGNTFNVSGEYSYFQNPGTGTLEIEATNASGTYTTTINGPFVDWNTFNYTVSGIIADGSPVSISIYFSDEITCTTTINDISPVLPTVTGISGGDIYCFGESIDEIFVDVTGNGPWTIDYTLDGIPQVMASTDSVANLGSVPGVYILTGVNDVGCTNVAAGTETITVQPLPEVLTLTGGGTYCPGDSVDDILADVSGTGPWILDYEFNGTPSVVNSAVNPIVLGSAAGTYTVTGITDAACSNVAVGNQTIVINPSPVVFAGDDFINCENDQIILSGSGAQSYVWDNSVQNGVGFIPTSTQTYTVIGTDVNGCTDDDDITVTFEALPVVSFVSDTTMGCEPSLITFVNTTPGNLQNCTWQFGAGLNGVGCDTVAQVYDNGGLYDITLTTTSINGCVNTITYLDYIYIENTPIASFSPSASTLLSLQTEVFFTNNSVNAVNYLWDFGDSTETTTTTHPVNVFPEGVEGTYTVTLIAYSPNNCTDTARRIIQINKEIIFYIPNSFTPDGDAFNQYFQPVFTDGYDPYDFEMLIFNRWGEIIFESHNAEKGWDGTYNGKKVQAGTYSWKIEFKAELTDERIMRIGHINLLK